MKILYFYLNILIMWVDENKISIFSGEITFTCPNSMIYEVTFKNVNLSVNFTKTNTLGKKSEISFKN